MKPRISTSLPCSLDRLGDVEFARIESTSWANVSRGELLRERERSGSSTERARAAPGPADSLDDGASLRIVAQDCPRRPSDRRSGQGGARPARPAARRRPRPSAGARRTAKGSAITPARAASSCAPQVGDPVADDDSGTRRRRARGRRIQEHDAENGRAPGAEGAHGGDLAPALEGRAVHRHEQVEQHDDRHDGQDERRGPPRPARAG